MDFSLFWDGEAVFWTYRGLGSWLPLGAAQFPHFAALFDKSAPAEARGCSPPFLTRLPEPGTVQIWTGFLARTAPRWSLLIRPPANLAQPGGFSLYEGIVETDRWFGPLFVNLRLTRTHAPVEISAAAPLAQIQPLPRVAYAEESLRAMALANGMEPKDWADYMESIVRPNDDLARTPGAYAIAARRRRRTECPFTGAVRA